MKTKNKILVALELEEQSLIALKYAEHFAKILDYEIETITVVEESSMLSKLFSKDEIGKKLIKDAKEQVNKTIAPFKEVDINAVVEYGKPYEKIVDYAKKINPSLIFMGKSEMPKYKRAFLGSNSLHVILESDFPVITIRGNYDFEKYKNKHKEILVPLDLGKDISEQISASMEFAEVLKSPVRLLAIETSGSTGEKTKMLWQLAKTKKAYTDKGIECSTELIQNKQKKVFELISEEATKRNAALIIIMTREENSFTDLFMGSNAREIINYSDIPVLSIEPWDKNKGSKVFSQLIDIFRLYKK